MGKACLVAACWLLLAIVAGCSAMEKFAGSEETVSSSQKASPAKVSPFPELDTWLTEHRMSVNAGQSDRFEYDRAFTQGVVIVYGEGRPALAVEGGQKRLTALRAAEVVAQRNLADYFARHATNGEIRFKSYNTRLDAFVKGAVVVASEYNAELGMAAVLLKLDLRGATSFAK